MNNYIYDENENFHTGVSFSAKLPYLESPAQNIAKFGTILEKSLESSLNQDSTPSNNFFKSKSASSSIPPELTLDDLREKIKSESNIQFDSN